MGIVLTLQTPGKHLGEPRETPGHTLRSAALELASLRSHESHVTTEHLKRGWCARETEVSIWWPM